MLWQSQQTAYCINFSRAAAEILSWKWASSGAKGASPTHKVIWLVLLIWRWCYCYARSSGLKLPTVSSYVAREKNIAREKISIQIAPFWMRKKILEQFFYENLCLKENPQRKPKSRTHWQRKNDRKKAPSRCFWSHSNDRDERTKHSPK